MERPASDTTMGAFRTSVELQNPAKRDQSATVSQALVDSGSELSWVPADVLVQLGIAREQKKLTFVLANGEQIVREVGFAIVRVQGHFTVDEIVFGEKGDLVLLGARTLEGLNLTVDPAGKKLVAAGPVPAAGLEGPFGR